MKYHAWSHCCPTNYMLETWIGGIHGDFLAGCTDSGLGA